MPKKPCVRTLMDSQHVKGSETFHKSTRHYFCLIFRSPRKKISSKYSFIEVSEILRLFVNILTPDDKYSLSVKASVSRNQFKCNYLKTKKIFLDFFVHFRNRHKLFNTFKKKFDPQRWFLSEFIDWKKRN